MFSRHQLKVTTIPWSQSNKAEAVRYLRRLMAERALELPTDDSKLKEQTLNYVEKRTAGGRFQYQGRGAHDDRVSVLLTIAMADIKGLIDSPNKIERTRVEWTAERWG